MSTANPSRDDSLVAAAAMPSGLFDGRQVALAAFLGGPAAGFAVMALNEARWGRRAAFQRYLLTGLAASASLFAVVALLPFTLPGGVSTLLHLGLAIGLKRFAERRQGARIEELSVRGVLRESTWSAVGIGLMLCAVQFALIVAVALIAT